MIISTYLLNHSAESMEHTIKANEKNRGITYVLVCRIEELQVDHFFDHYPGHEQAADFEISRDHDLIIFEDDPPFNLYR